jgi:hypothetical protein
MPDKKGIKMDYTKLKVSSGIEVAIRPRTYEEWEKQENERLRMVEMIDSLADTPAQNLALQRTALALRDARLNLYVEQFAKKKKELTLRDIAEIEKFALKLEGEEIPLGNSETGGNGQ